MSSALSTPSTALASEVEFEASQIEVADWSVPGDGKTPTFLQLLDIKGVDAKEASHLLSATSKGDIVYSLPLELPPALLQPSLALSYSSERGIGAEAPFGWELQGIMEIRRPLARAYDADGEDSATWDNAWLLSGPSLSGTLTPSGNEDNVFVLRAEKPTYVITEYDDDKNVWEVHSGGVTWTLEAQDDGASTPSGTALWRATKTKDMSGNYVTYCYDDNGRIQSISYGGNQSTGEEHLITVAFAYGDNTAKRTSARAGFLTTYDKHVEKITVQSGAGETCSSSSKGLLSAGGALKNGASLSEGPLSKGSGLDPDEAMSDAVVSATVDTSTITKGTNTIKGSIATGIKAGSGISSGSGKTGLTTGPAISRCTADSDDEEDSSNRLYAYDLVITVTDSLDLLTALEREGKTSCDVETIATFEYGEFDDSATAARTSTSMAPDSLGATESYSEDDDEPTVFETTKTLADVNRDGLPDVVDSSMANSSYEQWEIHNQKVDSTARSFSWDGPWTVNAKSEPLGAVTTEAVTDGSTATRALTTRQLVDFDGDGYLDIFITDNEDEWVVYYGNLTHNYGGTSTAGAGNSSVETPPHDWEYAQVAWALRAEDSSASSFTKDIALGMVDFNGDGWLDCYDPAEGHVWLHDGERESGFSTRLDLSYTFEALRSVKYTISSETFRVDTAEICEEACQEGCEEGADEAVDECQGECGNTCSDEDNYEEYCETWCREDCSDEEDTDECVEWCLDNDECDTGEAEDLCVEDCEDACEDGDGDEIPGRDEMVSECTDECDDDCEDIKTRSKYISATDETGALYDLNGDGLPDYVDASSRTWKVYFGNGHDFEAPASWSAPAAYIRRVDEGRPEIDWEYDEDDVSIDEHESGSPAEVYQMLLDVDGDGLLDLAMGQRLGQKWYKNTGSGFETSSRALPGWWPDDFVTSSSSSEVDGDEGSVESDGETTSLVTDLDHDGALDSVTTSKVSYGPYPAPYLLKKVTSGQGGTTSATYRSLATVSPSGDWLKEQYTPIAMHLADTIESSDTFTGQTAKSEFAYADGYYADGIFQGFSSREVERELNGAWSSKTEYEYELDVDFEPLVTTQKLYTDGNLNFGSELDRGATASKLRYELKNTYEDVNKYYHLVKNRQVTEYGESDGSESSSVGYNWDSHANLTSLTNYGGSEDGDETVTSFGYVESSSATGDFADFYRMVGKSVAGTDPITGTYQFVSSDSYYYDGNSDKTTPLGKGLLTRTTTAAGWLGGGETLTQAELGITYARGSRGEVESATDEATGVKMEQAAGFGGAVTQTQTNALGQALTREIDAQGRVTAITDPNGLKITSTYDAFNRVTKKQVTGTDGKTNTLATTSYSRDSAPYYDVLKLYGETGAAVETRYDVQNGFGQAMQTWDQDATGHYLVTTEIRDLRGLLTTASHPEDKGTSFSAPTSAVSVAKTLSRTYYDALGKKREGVRDAQVPTNAALVYRDSPRQESRQDESGFQTKLTYDAYDRVIKIEQGQSDSFTTTGLYAYDPMGRVVCFEDGEGTVYAYSYDAAGRLREVKYGRESSGKILNSGKTSIKSGSSILGALDTLSAKILSGKAVSGQSDSSSDSSSEPACSSARTTWYTYEYNGLLKTKMTDATGAYSSWEYDTLGRVNKITASDGLPTATSALEYGFAYDSAWIGKTDTTTDPAGTTDYQYDAYGRIKSLNRSYDGGTSATTPQFSYAYDLQGRLTSQTLPSGRKTESTYSYGHLTKLTAYASGVQEYVLSYAYNDWGLWSSVDSSVGPELSRTYTTPLWPDEYELTAGSSAFAWGYEWYDNGLLKQRTWSQGSAESGSSSLVLKGSAAASGIKAAVGSSATSGSNTSVSSALKGSTGSVIKSSATGAATARNISLAAGTGIAGIASSSTDPTNASVSPDGTVTTADNVYAYSYDELMQIAKIEGPAGLLYETYSYDNAGNPTGSRDVSGATWTYASATVLNEIASRSSDKGSVESYAFDAAGRVATVTDADGTKSYYFDGLGRLRGSGLDGTVTMVLDYDANGELIRRADGDPAATTTNSVYAFQEWRYDQKNGKTVEKENSFVTTENGARNWIFRDYDGTAMMTVDDSATTQNSRVSGAYGNALSSSGTEWTWEAFHGAEKQGDLYHMGQRHLTSKDGLWLQPEPLLYAGLEKASEDPLKLSTLRYARNTPTGYQDRSGQDPLVITSMDQYQEVRPIQILTPPSSNRPSMMEMTMNRAMTLVTRASEIYNSPNATPMQKAEALLTITANINPTSSIAGTSGNCERIGAAFVSSIRGQPAIAGYGPGGVPVKNYASMLGGNMTPVSGPNAVRSIMAARGDGAMGIVYSFTDGGKSTHVQAVINTSSLTDGTGNTSWFVEGQVPGETPSLSSMDRGEVYGGYFDYQFIDLSGE